MFVPKFIRTETPMAAKKKRGSAQELEEKIRIITIIGTRIEAAVNVFEKVN